MICIQCERGQTKPGFVTVVLQNAQRRVAIEQVPAEVCEQCGEYYLDHAVAQQVLHQARYGESTSQRYGLEILSPPLEPIAPVG
jgi:YgiT-type zinc finger domain-containing protein